MIKKLNEICSFVSGNAWKAAEFTDEGIPIIRINNMNTNGNDFVYWQGDYDKRYLVHKGDLLVSLSGTIKTFQWNGPEALLNQRIVKVVANPDTNQDWVYYQISHVIEEIANKGKHAVIKNVSVNDLKNFKVDVPDFQTQNKIVAILDKASALVYKHQHTIQLMDNLLKAEFLNMFQSDFENKKAQIHLEDLIIEGPQNGLYKHESFYGEGTPILRIDSFYDGLVIGIEKLKRVKLDENEIEKYSLSKDDVVINRVNSREYLGKSAIIPELNEPTVFESNMMRFKVNEELIKPQFLIFVLQLNFIKSQILQKAKDAINQSSINQKDVKSLIIPNCSMKEQLKFLTLYEKVTNSKRKALISLEAIELLFKALLQNAFTGRLNLNVSIELDALLKEIDLQKSENDLYSILSNEEYVTSLVERLNKQDFENQDLYDKAKHAAFQLLKTDEILAQKYDEDTKGLKLVVK